MKTLPSVETETIVIYGWSTVRILHTNVSYYSLLHYVLNQYNLVPRSRGWAKPKARSGQVRKFDFFDWLFQNMAVTALKFERALRGFSGPLGNSMSVFMQIRHCARNHNICILGTFRCLQSASKVKKISSQFFIAL